MKSLKPLYLLPSVLLAGCASYQEPVFDPSHPASAHAREAATAPARPMLGRDELTRETDRRFASTREVPTNKHPPIQPAGASTQEELGAEIDGVEQMRGTAAKPQTASAYRCVMHPEIRSDQPGKCPRCEMKLTKAKERSSDAREH